MPMDIEFDDKAIKYLVSPPRPTHPLRDIILTLDKSNEITSLAVMGRGLLRSCVAARTYTPPILEKFDLVVDNKVADSKLASVAERSGLLQRLNIDAVAISPPDLARILCAYLGATFRCAWKEHGLNTIHTSINDICSLILSDDEEPAVVQNNSHEKMTRIPGVEQVTVPAYPKVEPPSDISSPMPTRKAQHMPVEIDTNSNESVSSGRSPPPPMFGSQSLYMQPFQPYYPPNPSNPPPSHPLQHIHPQSGPFPQRFASHAPGPVPTSSPSFISQMQPQAGLGGYQQVSYPQTHGISNNMASSSWQPTPPNPPGYGIPAQAAPQFSIPPPPTQQTQGFISLFNELAMKNRMVTSWQQQKTGQQHIPEWTMWLIVDGTPRGHGTAPTKQGAKEIAAKAALQAMGWLAV
ncbi:hypothetical protein FRC07_006368 [Ceratobasidium sp. 392]|nr:hypothetical protein FRC07_006368 [Ceratobasidium sp. 392]